MRHQLHRKTARERGIIHPVKGKGAPTVGPDAIMVMIASELRYLVRVSMAQEIPFNEMSIYHLFQTKKGADIPLTLSGPFLGAPHATIGMEKLIVLGAKRIWVLGWCASLQSDLRIGQVVIPTSAVSEEGTSSHYPISGHTPESDAEMTLALEDALERRRTAFSKGWVWTTDALYRETPQKVLHYQKRGVLAVEMEMSALMTLALYRSVAMAGLMVVSDELFDLKWRPGFSNSLLKKNSRVAGEVLLELACSLSQSVIRASKPSTVGDE